MTELLDQVISKLSNALRRKFNDFRGLYLFGASVDGEIHEDEDIEIVALFDTEDKTKREQIWPVIGKIETELDVCIDLYPFTPEGFKQDEDLYKEVTAEGVFYNALGIKQQSGIEP